MGHGANQAVQAYVKALDLSAFVIAAGAGGARCRVLPSGDPDRPPRGSRVAAVLWCLSSAQAELLAEAVDAALADHAEGAEWFSVQPAVALEASRIQAQALGIEFREEAEVESAAAQAVATIDAELKAAQRDGRLQEINRAYQVYRLACVAEGKAAMPYFGWMQQYRMKMIRTAASTSRMLQRESFGCIA